MQIDDSERQKNELLVLESIYGEGQFILCQDCNGGQLSIVTNVPDEFKLVTDTVQSEEMCNREENCVDVNKGSSGREGNVRYLPPLLLNFTFPADYPSKSPPDYHLSCKWLNVVQLTKMCQMLDKAWEEQDFAEIMYEWTQILSNDTLTLLNIKSALSLSLVTRKMMKINSIDPRAHQDVGSIDGLVTFLVDYDLKERQERFEKSYFTCNVCFCEKIGKDGAVFQKCKHVYCNECMTDYFKVQIADGLVRALTCPEDKCDSQADPGLVKKLVPTDVFERYDKYLLQSTLECMNEISYCPRLDCQSPVLQEPDENLARCPICSFVFCVLCKRSYHGVARCPVTAAEVRKLRAEYLNGTPEEKAMLEKRYGKKKLQQAVEEHYSEAWLETFSKKCSSCNTSIQKIDGCNKMTCFKCRNNFCWLCLKILTGNPYNHFNDSRTGCFNRLFEGITMDDVSDEEDEDGWVNLVGR